MNVLRLHHVPHNEKLVTRPNFVQNREEQISIPRFAKQWKPPMATASDEVQVALPVASFEAILQGQVKPTHSRCGENAAPAKPTETA